MSFLDIDVVRLVYVLRSVPGLAPTGAPVPSVDCTVPYAEHWPVVIGWCWDINVDLD